MFEIPCKKCGGKGVIPYYRHINGGECFDCSGSGIEEVSKEEYDAYLENEKFKKRVKEKGTFVVFNKTTDEFEYFNSLKEVTGKYGSLYSFVRKYAGYSAYFCNSNEDLVIKKYYGDDSFIQDFRKQVIIDKKDKLKKWIEMLNEWLKKAIENKKFANEIPELKSMIKEAEQELKVIS
ncbi:hypothetical protein C7M22_03670 [Bacillus velezensis]|uniref:hypothetical protein n=1 Tax=Bacillus velezensis TaxID=492670 RepID=UPI000987EBCA|nr:hypothetical protein [Bacillus velezensis]AQS44122.1 hypothetical protein BVH55_09475 [Bacillus velezensis]QHK65712.1 hypothetical protein C7M22_03670 [Bacillus velezensis]QHL98554.1 hypothetical protein C7M25_02780 [Bacillus velezensis]WNR79498.1 hypothetical protein RP314_11340 [Bacillus velezensis]